MKWVVDAQLPRRLTRLFATAGHDAIHTADLPAKNRTPDPVILDISDREGRIVVTKDQDFVESFLLQGRPEKLLLIATGNITNEELEFLLKRHFAQIVGAFETARFVELNRTMLTIHS